MKKTILLTMGLLAAGTLAAHAADLEQPAPPAAVMAPASPAVYVQILAGPTLPLDQTLFDPIPPPGTTTVFGTKVGYAAAGTIGVVVVPGVAIEGDVMYTHRDFSTVAGSISSLSGMLNVKGSMDVSDSFAIYAAAGLGYINYTDSGFAPAVTAGGFGYQLIGGAAFKVAEKISLLGEVRYQNTFAPVALPSTATISQPTVSLLAGLKFDF